MKPNDPIFDNEMPMSDNEASLAESDALLKEWDNSPIDDEALMRRRPPVKPNDPIFDNEMPMSDNEASLAESDALLKEWDNSPIDDEAFYSAAASAMEPETVEEESQNDQEATCDPTSRKTQPFDVVSAKLTIPTLLEASAGTGKTFSIKHLVLRLIVEEKMPINQLLVVTFTRAATDSDPFGSLGGDRQDFLDQTPCITFDR